MNEAFIREWADEVDRFAIDTEHLHQLLTTELGKVWTGEAYEACRRESRDNRELALEAVHAYREIIEKHGYAGNGPAALPSDFLL